MPRVNRALRRFKAEIAEEIAIQKFTCAELDEEHTDLATPQGWPEKIRRQDLYGAQLSADSTERLRGCETLPDGYAQRVFDAYDENR